MLDGIDGRDMERARVSPRADKFDDVLSHKRAHANTRHTHAPLYSACLIDKGHAFFSIRIIAWADDPCHPEAFS